MGANFPSIIFANGYTDESLIGGGAIKGANCTITSITPVTVGDLTGNKITFEWTLNDGSKRQNSFNVMNGKDGEDGADGVSVVGFTLIDDSHFVWDFSDSSQSSPIEIPSGNVDISAEAGNALVKKPDGLYVGATGVEISQEADNAIENKADGLYVKKTSDVEISKEANNAIVSKPDGLFVDISQKVDKVAGKELISSTLIPKITNNEDHIGDMTQIAVTSITDLVSYCNVLYNSFMASITYANKEVIITYRNGATVKIDVSAIITDTNIGELNNVDDAGITDGQVLHYEAASQKYKPHTIDLAKVLSDAKAYTDEIAAALDKKKAEIVDEEPVYDASGEKPIITYKQNGETKTTDDTDMWFYYTADGKTTQVIWINGVELKLAVDNAADFSDLVSKTKDVVSTYTGEELDKTKIPDLAALDALKALVDTELSNKVNTADIVDNLASDAVDKPLSAAQGKALNTNKLDKKTDASNAHKAVVVDEEGNLVFGEAGVQVSAATGNTIETKADGIFVEAEIHEVTEAEYEAMSEAERDGKNWLIKDKIPQTVDKYLVDDTNVSEQKAYSSKKVNDELAKINDSLVDLGKWEEYTEMVNNVDGTPTNFKAYINRALHEFQITMEVTTTYNNNGIKTKDGSGFLITNVPKPLLGGQAIPMYYWDNSFITNDTHQARVWARTNGTIASSFVTEDITDTSNKDITFVVSARYTYVD